MQLPQDLPPQLMPVLRSALGGAAGAVITLALILAIGLISVTPLGPQAAPIGIVAAFSCVIVSASIYALVARHALPAGSPTSATGIVIATLVAQLASACESFSDVAERCAQRCPI